MKTYRELMESFERRALTGWNAKDHSIAAAEKQKKLDALDAKLGDNYRNPGTARHDLHKQIINHKKKQKELGG